MEELQINLKKTKLIVQSYQKINSVKRLLDTEPYPQIKEFLESGSTLIRMMNLAIETRSKGGFILKLGELSAELERLSAQGVFIQDAPQLQELTDSFNQLKSLISSLQSNIHAQR